MKSINYKASVCLLVMNIHLSASVFISGNGAFPLTFNTPVVSKTYNRATGTLYVGLAAPDSGVTTGNYAISAISRFGLNELPTFQAIATPSTITNTLVGALTLATKQGDTTPLLVGLPGVLTGSPQSPMVFALSTDGFQTFVESAPLLDASGASGENGQETNGIAAIAANQEFIFAAVRPNEAESDGIDFGNTNSGIAVVRINYDLAAAHQPVDNLQQTAAVQGDDGIKAVRLDMNSNQLFINPPGTVNNDTAIMYWDDQLQRLYIAVNVTSGTNPGPTGPGIRSVAVAQVDSAGVMTIVGITPTGAIIPQFGPGAQNQIVAGVTTDGQIDLSVNKLSVMHCSTGPSYLIVNGGNGTNDLTGNLIFALPLVDDREADGDIDTTDEVVQGILAKKDSPLNSLNRFTVPAINPGDLVENPLNGGTGPYDQAALVGGAPLPIEVSSIVSDMVVLDDTVYVSFDTPQGVNEETGIIYSQAQFDEMGKIISWSPWSKRAFPINGLPGLTNATRIFFFDVDAVTGNIWAIGGDTQQTVASTGWDLGSSTVSLPTQLNNALPTGCFSVLDLDVFTRGFTESLNPTPNGYALFGGVNQVVFALISSCLGTDPVGSAQAVTNDFSEAENFLVTKVNAHASITSLEYSRNTETNSNYFFAGTQNGLFVFANAINGSGFSVSELSTLEEPPFTTSKWIKAPNIPGAIIDMKTLGNALYVLTFQTTPAQPLQSTVYKITIEPLVATTFEAPIIVAQTGVGVFENIQLFNGINLIATSDDSTTEQLVLATNQGVFRSSTAGGVQTATNQAQALWEPVLLDDTTMYLRIPGFDAEVVDNGTFVTSAPSTVWPISVNDANGEGTFDSGSIHQLNGTTEAIPYNFIPTQFNGDSVGPNFTNLLPILNFWSDGARRFFIVKRLNQDPPTVNRIMVSPYEVQQWNVQNPAQNILQTGILQVPFAFYWVKEIGASGIILAGTNRGVVALE